jgi:superfamily II DNA/RNA helicase
MSFKILGVNAALTKVLHSFGIEKPFTIQKATLPDAIAAKDILGRGQTGSGKTLAFGLALMTRLVGRTATSMQPLAFVLSPTRELAMQISDVIAPLSRSVGLARIRWLP